VTVPQPCDCSPSQLIDVAGIVAGGLTNNDNASIKLAWDTFESPPDPRRLDLPCGRYYLSKITTSQPGTIVVHGRAALFIGGDFAPNAPFTITVDPQAELDIFINGDILISDSVFLGSTLVPAQLRIYGAGSQIDISSNSRLAGNLYMPTGDFVSHSNLELFGALFVKSFTGQGGFHYDRGVLNAGRDCDKGVTCNSCRDCQNQACNGGRCGSCTTSADCCAPLDCVQGVCTLPLR
jgi:hypothetical protein